MEIEKIRVHLICGFNTLDFVATEKNVQELRTEQSVVKFSIPIVKITYKERFYSYKRSTK